QLETFNLRGFAGYIQERSNTPLGGTPFNVAGSLGTPDVTANVSATYGIGPYSIQLQQRHIDAVKLNANWVEGVDVDDNFLPSGNYTNMRLGYSRDMDSGATWNVSLNIANLFDRH